MSYIQSTQAQGLFEFYAINIVTALTPQRLKYAYFSSKVPHARAHVTIKHKHQRFNITPYGCICTNILRGVARILAKGGGKIERSKRAKIFKLQATPTN